MESPTELCVCFHVPFQKVAKFIRLNNPQVPSQCSECFGAGTGCGWCVPFIEKLFEEIRAGEQNPQMKMSADEYRQRRREYMAKTRQDLLELEDVSGESVADAGELQDEILPDDT
ncbi:(2Fe-2S)-binding protein [bacterium]|nr:(2Fe-2S)-binding protein [bacterium]